MIDPALEPPCRLVSDKYRVRGWYPAEICARIQDLRPVGGHVGLPYLQWVFWPPAAEEHDAVVDAARAHVNLRRGKTVASINLDPFLKTPYTESPHHNERSQRSHVCSAQLDGSGLAM